MTQPSLDNDPPILDHSRSIREQLLPREVGFCREQIVRCLRMATICLRAEPCQISTEEESQIQRAADFALLLVNQPKLARFIGQLDDCLEDILDGAFQHVHKRFEDDTLVKRHTANEAAWDVLTYIDDLKLWAQFTRILDLQRDKS